MASDGGKDGDEDASGLDFPWPGAWKFQYLLSEFTPVSFANTLGNISPFRREYSATVPSLSLLTNRSTNRSFYISTNRSFYISAIIKSNSSTIIKSNSFDR